MKVQQWLAIVTLALAVPTLASAQSQSGTTTAQDPASTTGQTDPGTTSTSGATGTTGTTGTTDTATGTTGTTGSTAGTTGSATTADTTANTAQQGFGGMYDNDAPSHWTASGFVGSHFGDQVESQIDFGGSLGYMWRGAFGAEFLAGFSPNFQFANNILPGDEPQINTYMGNLVGAIPLGFDANWQPFVSGGLGAITLRSDFTTSGDAEDAFDADATQMGGNIGFGVMGFAGAWGVRGDVRYFRGFNGDNADNTFEQNVLSDLDFWRANIGVAVRW